MYGLFCHTCNGPLERDNISLKMVCPHCSSKRSLPGRRQRQSAAIDAKTVLKLPGLQPGKQSVQPKISEDAVQSHIIGALRNEGYTVLETSEHRKAERCPHCEKWMRSKVGRGSSKGVPDLLVTKDTWPQYAAALLEVKGPQTRLSPEQKVLEKTGRIAIVRSLSDAHGVLAKLEEHFRRLSLSPLVK